MTPTPRLIHLLPATLALSLIGARGAAAQIVIVDGDSLVDAVATASDGETIIIQSDSTFEGTLSWSSKELTIRAGFGYSPTVKGDFDSAAISLGSTSTPTVANLKGLRIVRGDFAPTSSPGFAAIFSGTGSGTLQGICSFQDCTLLGDVSVSGTGDFGFELELDGSTLLGDLLLSGTGDSQKAVQVHSNSRVGQVYIGPTSNAVVSLMVADSRIVGGIEASAALNAVATGAIRRSRIEGPVTAAQSSTSQVDILIESTLITGDGSGTGVFSTAGAQVEGVNLTVTGFDIGLDAGLGAQFANLALFGNGVDLAPVVLPIQIATSLIEDGTYAGFSGNFGGTPAVDSNFALTADSIGIDAGNSMHPELGAGDLNGDARVQDSDGDGVATVNVGAIETLAPCVLAAFEYFNGSGANPTFYTVDQAPALGASLVATVATNPSTVATIVALGNRSASPLVLPGFQGELLLELAPFPLLDVATGVHVIPVPDDASLCGAIIDTQALRADLLGFGLVIRAGNGARLTLGE